MKKYLVIGNPIDHSLSPKLHNYWIKQNNLDAVYDKKLLNENDIGEIITEVKNGKIDGVNVTIPFKKSVIPFLNQLTPLAEKAQSVNTIFKKDNKVFGDNTDIGGFERALKYINYNVKNKKVFILGAGGVVSSIILVLPGAVMLWNQNIGLLAGLIFAIVAFGIMLTGIRSAASAYRYIFIDSYGV